MADPLPDEPSPAADQLQAEEGIARGDALKGFAAAAEDLYSTAPIKVKARNQIEEGYRNAKKDLDKVYEAADQNFRAAASNLTDADSDGSSYLGDWIAEHLADGAPLVTALALKGQLGRRLKAMEQFRFAAMIAAQDEAKQAEAAYAAWSAPHQNIRAIIDSYAKDLDSIIADINHERDLAWTIFRLWFVIAPRHLQLRSEPVTEANAPGVDAIRQALVDRKLQDRADALESASEGTRRGLFLIAPADLAQKRRTVLTAWREAAENRATAAAAYKLRNDDPAKLVERIGAAGAAEAETARPLLIS